MSQNSTNETFEWIIQFVNKVLYLCGHSLTNDMFYKYPLSVYRRLVLYSMLFQPFCALAYMNGHWTDLDVIIKCLTISIGHVQGVSRTIVFGQIHLKVMKIIEAAREFRIAHIKTENEFKILKKYNKYGKFVAYGFICLLGASYVSILIPPLLESEKRLPMAYFIPYIPHDTQSPYFEINWIYQFFQMSFVILIILAIDILLISLILEACLQIEIIGEKLSYIGNLNNELKQDISTQKEQLQKLNEIHLIHLKCRQFVKTINTEFSAMLLIQICVSTLGITTVMYRVAQNSDVDMYEYEFAQAMTTQVFIWCFIGEQVSSKMNSMIHSLYNNNWYNLDSSGKKSLFIMMSCCQKQFNLSAGGWTYLNLRTFLSIMKTAYSYYAVMQDSTH